MSERAGEEAAVAECDAAVGGVGVERVVVRVRCVCLNNERRKGVGVEGVRE